jgi:asparagine synthase (glutamine-hydrolysing)
MCGIAGIVKNEIASEQEITTMTNSMIHRGPDSHGIYLNGRIGLGHRRLSIIDLSVDANQPMWNSTKDAVIVFNGEIYNYPDLRSECLSKGCRFKTNSDTEVIIEMYKLYGEDFINRLRGMFAIAIYDLVKEVVFLYRDRIGIKPLFYSIHKEELFFASEIKAIASVLKDMHLDHDSFYYFFRTSLYTEDTTVFSEVRQLLPGHLFKFDLKTNTHEIKKYYDIYNAFLLPKLEMSDTKIISSFSEKLHEVVKMHMLADVPVGTFLSGGLDSSIITALAASVVKERNLYTASVIFPTENAYYNEEDYSDLVANQYNTNHHKVLFNGSFLQDMSNLAWHSDEPFGIVSSYALYELSRHVSKDVKVVLTGDGADENLAGYFGLFSPYRSKYRSFSGLLGFMAKMLKPFINISPAHLNYYFLKLKDSSGGSSYDFSNASAYSSTTKFEILFNRHLLAAIDTWKQNNRRKYYDVLHDQSELRKMLFTLTKTRLIDEMLKKVDRMTMAHSLEARVPFLDHELVELMIQIPDHLKYQIVDGVLSNKFVLRKAAEKYIDKKIIYRKKHGFDMPLNKWIREEIDDIKNMILSGFLVEKNVIDKSQLEKMFALHLNGRQNSAFVILNIYAFETWHNVYLNRIPGFKLNLI